MDLKERSRGRGSSWAVLQLRDMLKGWEGEGWHLYLTETTGTVTTVWIRKEYTSCLSLEALALSWWGFGSMINECQCS